MGVYSKLRIAFTALAVLLSDVMCAVVAWNYCALEWGGRYASYSAPPETAFIYAVPYGIGIAACLVIARVCRARARGRE